MTTTGYARSAVTLTSGLALTILGQLMFENGRIEEIVSGLQPIYEDSSTNLLVAGGLIGFTGVIVLLVGVYQLARNVDLAARVAHETLTRAASDAGAPPPATVPAGPTPTGADTETPGHAAD